MKCFFCSKPGDRYWIGFELYVCQGCYASKRDTLLPNTDDPCVYCGRPSQSLDHIVPRCKGGTRNYNLAPACLECNQAKAGEGLLQFLTDNWFDHRVKWWFPKEKPKCQDRKQNQGSTANL